MWLNIPVLSWLWLRGKCAACGAKISARYMVVELLTGGLFLAAWLVFPPQAALCLWVLVSLLVAISFIDAEHMIIPVGLTWAGSAVGLLACAWWPQFPVLAGTAGTWLDGLKGGAIGWLVGFGGLWLVARLGKMAFGKTEIRSEEPLPWRVREQDGEEKPLLFEMGEQAIEWWDIFYRKTDELILETQEILVNDKLAGQGKLIIREQSVVLPDGSERKIEDMQSLSGRATSAVVPREAMGSGDMHLLGMIGAFFGWSGACFALFAASIYAIAVAVAGRIGFGRQLPFGPYLALGALTWAFAGWKLWAWYLHFLGW